jgi:hypothetical protein
MTRSLVSRVLCSALALWTTLFMSESERLVRCPTHDGASHAATTQVANGESNPAHDHHASATDSLPGGSQSGEHSCSCPGPGCCPPAVATLPQRVLGLAHIVAVHVATAVSALERFAESSEYLHPPATAPPAVGLAPSA